MTLLISGRIKNYSHSESSTISVDYMNNIIERLKSRRVRQSTAENYLTIWRLFNKFVLRLDRRPPSWEDKDTLLYAYLIDKGYQSSTVKSYMSAIKSVLQDDGYSWSENKVLISALTRAC